MNTDAFVKDLTVEILNSVNNNYTDNRDPYRYGEPQAEKKSFSIRKKFVSTLNKNGFYNKHNLAMCGKQIKRSSLPLHDFSYLHNLLEDEYSKELLIKIIAYRLLGDKKVKLPVNTPEFWKSIKTIESHLSKTDVADIGFLHFHFHLIDLRFLNVPVTMYANALGIYIDFIFKQYELHRQHIHIEASPGDVVIDGGGCYGDTALYFANKVGTSGAVHVFEFIPDNLNLFNTNIDLNPHLKPVIKLITNPLWSVSGSEVFYQANGPGSRVSLEYFKDSTGKTTTLTIDDYVSSQALEKVDFIKMDIEGAETNALRGSVQTIKKFRPKLSIALYHNTIDFDAIPRFINELGLGYKFYLLHSTIYVEETVLFAQAV